ncbi:carboxylesterase family protein (plasmid) [Streptomyces sp. NBC_00536]|uniref:carboxylesterase/lipase family protein n=1 Tax=Streptomyces sp. NBC_00536 TaxID=2975769 RepID=UPI002E80AA02|nr:carboxylesterase family protein [Streptomyces sp. NBC_00536]WUC84120.1 carboxylesterase family protein [Streptomyces sp. NBC_00536]
MEKERHPEVRTGQGVVRGRVEDGIAVFRGIPYARPPFGALRFAAPEPAAPWDGVRPALEFGPPPPQYDRMSPRAAAGGAGGAAVDRAPDCLTVNVWSPALGSVALPVMVWFHGGAYVFGSAADPVYDGARLARRDVVVVTFNYRVGMEGFGQLAGAPANRGLLDQIAALRWVRENIAAFGGAPDDVTLFGESAGAGSIAALLAMPAAAGLFHQAVAQSVPGSYFTPELASRIAGAVGARVGAPATARALRDTDPHLLVRAADQVFAARGEHAEQWGTVAHAETVFSPVVDGESLPRTPWEAVAQGAARDLALMFGHNRDEYRLFMAKRGEFGEVSGDRADTALRVFGPGGGGGSAYRRAYPGAGAEELYETVMSDWMCRMPTVQLLEAQVAAGGVAYAYELRWPAPVSGGRLGACHGLDVPLVFGTLDAPLARQMLGESAPAAAGALSERMQSAWARFALYGDPGWPGYRAADRLSKVFDCEDALLGDPVAASRKVWRNHSFTALEPR